MQHGADPNIRNTEGKTPLDIADPVTRPVLTGKISNRKHHLDLFSCPFYFIIGEYRKEEVLEAARAGCEERLGALLTPLAVNCHAADGRRSTPLHLAAGYNRARACRLLLQRGADVHAKDKG